MAEVTLTYCVLAHESTARVERLADKLLKEDATGQVIVHFDRKSGIAPYQSLRQRYADEPRCHVLADRMRCGWGQWSLVEATLRMLRYAQLTRKTDYYYLLSEYCYPTQPLSALKQHLTRHRGTNFIECEGSSWIKGGIREDRYLYRHFLNKRRYPKLHRWTYKWQKWLGLKRKVPEGLTIRFGSQWWCLTQEAVAHVLRLEPYYRNFFRWVWIPDECFFSSILSDSESFIDGKLTYTSFDTTGRPVNYDYIPYMSGFYFIRKFSGEDMSDSSQLVPYWENIKRILKEKDGEGVLETWKEWLSSKHLTLPHPHINDLKTYARRSYMPFLGWGNLVLFSDENGDNGWFLYQAYNICDAVYFDGNVEVIAKENRVWKEGSFGALKFKKSLDYMLGINEGCLYYKETRLLVEHARPYHFIYEQFANLDTIKEASPFDVKVSERAPFLSSKMLGHQANKVDENSYVYLLPLMFVHYRRNEGRRYAKDMERNVISFCNSKTNTKPDNTLRIWFGVTGVKRSWVEQVSACVSLVDKLLRKYEFVELLVDGMTATQNGDGNFKEDQDVYKEIANKIGSKDRVRLINLVGSNYADKIKEAGSCDYFVANSGSGCIVPLCFSSIPGCIHGIIDTFEVERKESSGRVTFLKKMSKPLKESGNKAAISYSLNVEEFLRFAIKDIKKRTQYNKLDVIRSKLVDGYRKADLLRDLALYFESKGDLSTALKIMREAKKERPHGPLIESKIVEYSIALGEEVRN